MVQRRFWRLFHALDCHLVAVPSGVPLEIHGDGTEPVQKEGFILLFVIGTECGEALTGIQVCEGVFPDCWMADVAKALPGGDAQGSMVRLGIGDDGCRIGEVGGPAESTERLGSFLRVSGGEVGPDGGIDQVLILAVPGDLKK